MANLISRLGEAYPGRHDLISQLTTLLTTVAPPCIHIHTPLAPRPTAALVRAILAGTQTAHAWLHGVECLSARLVFDRVLHALAGWEVRWADGCAAFGAGAYHGDLDGFLEGLRAITRTTTAGNNMVIVVEGAERFKEKVPELMVPLTRLEELSGLPVTTIFISEASWFDLRPALGAAPDPFLINVSKLNRQDAIATLIAHFPDNPVAPLTLYSSLLKPLYVEYIEALHSVCAPFVSDMHELAYLAAACWPGFVSPVLAEWRASSRAHLTEDGDEDISSFVLPSDDARMRLVRIFTPTFTNALEMLYPRTQHAREWITKNAPSPDLQLSELLARGSQHRPPVEDVAPAELTVVAKFVLVAAFLASVNPPKRDARMVGRAPDQRGKKRRGGARRPRGGGSIVISPRLGGPAAFPLDRLIAILGSLMEEHDDCSPTFDEDNGEGEPDAEMAVGRIQVSATISELVAMRLLHRTTPADKLDGPPSFKCGVSQQRAFELARELGIAYLGDFMWDAS